MKYTTKIGLILFFAFTLMCYILAQDYKRDIIYLTPYDWVEMKHFVDSINITKEEPKYAVKHIEKYLGRKGEFKILDSEYDDSLKAYMIRYKFRPFNKETYYNKKVWVRINFKINNGDYIAKPEIIKVVRIINE